MKKRWPLLLLFVALAGAALWLWRSNTGTTLAGPLADFMVADTAAIDRIFIADKRGGLTIDLRRTDQGWTVNGLPASPNKVDLLLKTFLLVEVRSPVAKSAEANVLKVMSSTTKKVEIYQGGKEPVKIWYMGHATQDHYGTYMLLEKPGVGKSSTPFVMGMAGFTGVLPPRFHNRLDEWRATNVTDYPDLEKVKKVQVDQPKEPEQGFSISYEGASNLELRDAQEQLVPMDSARVKDLLLLLRNGHFEYFEREISKAQRDSVMASLPWHVLTVNSDRGVQKVTFWQKNPRPGERNMDLQLIEKDVDRMYALVDDTALVVVQRYWFDRMVPPLDLLRAKSGPPSAQ